MSLQENIQINTNHIKVKVKAKHNLSIFPVVTTRDDKQYHIGDHVRAIKEGEIIHGEIDCTGNNILYDISQFEENNGEFYGEVVKTFFRYIPAHMDYVERIDS